jgi:hypothetical protein
MTIVEPGGARTEFRYGSAQVAQLMPVYDQTPAHSFLKMLDPKNGLAPGDPARMAAHYRGRGRGTRAAAHGTGVAGTGKHTCDPTQADRRLRSAA